MKVLVCQMSQKNKANNMKTHLKKTKTQTGIQAPKLAQIMKYYPAAPSLRKLNTHPLRWEACCCNWLGAKCPLAQGRTCILKHFSGMSQKQGFGGGNLVCPTTHSLSP
jgi:hypothetical protein